LYTFRTGTGPGYRHINLACAKAIKLSRCHLFYCQWNFGFVTEMVFMTLRWGKQGNAFRPSFQRSSLSCYQEEKLWIKQM